MNSGVGVNWTAPLRRSPRWWPASVYEKAQEIVQAAQSAGRSIREVAIERGLLTAAEFDRLVSPEAVTRLGSPE